jgi:hypothetical protein
MKFDDLIAVCIIAVVVISALIVSPVAYVAGFYNA